MSPPALPPMLTCVSRAGAGMGGPGAGAEALRDVRAGEAFDVPWRAWEGDARRLAHLLAALPRGAAAPAAVGVAWSPGSALQAFAAIAEGDGPTPPAGPAEVQRALIDAGWWPTLAEAEAGRAPSGDAADAARALLAAQGVPAGTAEAMLAWRRLRFEAIRDAAFDAIDTTRPVPAAGRFAVCVPTTREGQLARCVEASPGLAEVQAPIVSVRGAPHSAAAVARALEVATLDADAEWLLVCHQDVVFARGFGHGLAALLAAIPPAERPATLIGFAGVGVGASGRALVPAGFVVDRVHRFDHPATAQATSIDEFALVLHRDSVHRIEPALGWHLWATDLCLVSIAQHRVFPRIVRLPVWHHSLNDHRLPAAFHASARVLAARHAGWGPITTLCGVIDATTLCGVIDATTLCGVIDATTLCGVIDTTTLCGVIDATTLCGVIGATTLCGVSDAEPANERAAA
jgi:hypothetical protein